MSTQSNHSMLRIGLPKGHMAQAVGDLLHDAGISVTPTERGLRPRISLPDTEVKVLKPQNIVEMLDLGSRDVGFAGADWVRELSADVVDVLDTGLNPVQVVAATTASLIPLPERQILIATEYMAIARAWITDRAIDADVVRSYGATEVFPPEDADVIVENTATGATLRANSLEVFDVLFDSSTRLYASRRAMDDPEKRDRIADLGLVLSSVLNARQRVMLEVNVPEDKLPAIVSLLPCMREATVASLYGDQGYAVRAAVPRRQLPALMPAVKAAGGCDLVVTAVEQIVP